MEIIEKNIKTGLDDKVLVDSLKAALDQYSFEKNTKLKRVLLLPPDFTRNHSGAGKLTNMLYNILTPDCQLDIMPALGTHMAMTNEEIDAMFGSDIPKDCFKVHNWRHDVVKIGEVPESFVKEVSEGLIEYKIDVELNKRLLDKKYDLILSLGQVVPHEVVGMANFTKNILVGCGGTDIINKSHMLGAVYGMERMMGRDNTPVRKVFDYAEKEFLKDIPLMYVLTVTTQEDKHTNINGLFIGRERKVFEEAVEMSQQLNLIFVDGPFKKVVVYLDPKEFKSTWLGNKSIYRTRMAIADGGELIVLAPGVRQFGEDKEIDRLIRKYGYLGRDKILEIYKEGGELASSPSVAAHLIHGSSDDRFNIIYAVDKLSKEEVEKANFKYMPYSKAVKKYNPKVLKDGFNTLEDGGTIYYISNPALGLWAEKGKFI